MIEKEVQDILGRERFEIAKGDGELSEQTRESRRAKKKRQVRRASWRKHHGSAATVWADNKPVAEKFKFKDPNS